MATSPSLEKGPGVLEGPRGTSRGLIQVTHLTPEPATIPLGAERRSPAFMGPGRVASPSLLALHDPREGTVTVPTARHAVAGVGVRIPGGQRSVRLRAPAGEQASPWKGGVPEASPRPAAGPGVERSPQTDALGLTGGERVRVTSVCGDPRWGPGGSRKEGLALSEAAQTLGRRADSQGTGASEAGVRGESRGGKRSGVGFWACPGTRAWRASGCACEPGEDGCVRVCACARVRWEVCGRSRQGADLWACVGECVWHVGVHMFVHAHVCARVHCRSEGVCAVGMDSHRVSQLPPPHLMATSLSSRHQRIECSRFLVRVPRALTNGETESQKGEQFV